ncbi:chemotaxis protein [Malaciobacter canalis]|uniref:Chemotaxis protein n=1 Tax=Malaciobacter canalis TaxID=1912871 RepID=A0ABX4LNQ5_9BACT|nr:methyl-accepting chemotaxis protein [Malaciobacter canalis]PHO09530.1 chemotaxis protein [Malaciobacter canalis]QEE31596.1 MCP-domain signal transduction protein [Malaciobacter canalis]
MLNKLSIMLKLKLNSALIIFSLLIAGVIIYNILNSLSREYINSLAIAKQNETLNAIYINGLLYNSSSGVVFQNPNSKKAKNTMQNAIKNTQKAANEFKKINNSLYMEFEQKVIDFLLISKTLNKKVIDNHALEKDDMKKSLKAWRNLKFTIIDILKIIKKNSDMAQKNFHNTIKQSIITVIVLMSIFSIIILIFNILLSKSIISPLEILKDAMKKLTDSSNKDIKIEIKTKDETAQIAKYFNEYISKIEKDHLEDTLVINDVNHVVNEIKKGNLSTRVTKTSSSKSVKELVNALNSMLDTLADIIEHASITLNKYKQEDFTQKTSINAQGEIQSLLNGIDSLGESISKMLVESTKRGVELKNSSDDLLKNVDVLNESSIQTATNLEETTAALEQITSNVKNNTQKMNDMTNLARKVSLSTKDGKELALKTSISMDEINEQVNLINNSITVIDQIAFQTNILSLNAAVEAATAGELGKGFAVVAGEVRNLATRSAQAAKEIKALVEHATIKANDGKEISSNMINGYESLNDNIEQTLNIIEDVSTSSKEQERGIIQINNVINELDQKTQKNATIASQVQEIAIFSEKLATTIVYETKSKNFIGKNK